MLNELKWRLEQLIAHPSVSSTQAHLDLPNRPVVDLLADWFDNLGFKCERLDVAPGKSNLIATIGSGGDGLVLSGHTDTVPCDEALWTNNPFALTEKDDRWYGLGVIDMKGFFPLVIEALADFDLTAIRRPLVVVATCDEESSMAGARRLAEVGRRLGRATLIGEPTGLQPVRAHKGIMMERLSLQGQSGHSSDPSLGRNALDAMSDCLNALKALRRQWVAQYRHQAFVIPHPTLNFGCIHGGDNPNRICGQCQLDFDVRTIPGMTIDDIRSGIEQVIKPICEKHGVTFNLKGLIEPLPSFEESVDAAILSTVEQLTGATASTVAFGTEAPFFQTLSDEVIVMGAGSIDVAHQPDEYLDLSDIKPAVRYLRQVIHQYCFAEFPL